LFSGLLRLSARNDGCGSLSSLRHCKPLSQLFRQVQPVRINGARHSLAQTEGLLAALRHCKGDSLKQSRITIVHISGLLRLPARNDAVRLNNPLIINCQLSILRIASPYGSQ
jgi:hypothetical protein